jgi:hypothetical protein
MVGQTITCPNPLCHKPFKVEVPAAEPVPNLVISPGLAQEVTEEKPAPASPPKAETAAADVEHDLIAVHPMMFRRYPFRCIAYALVAVVGLALLLAGVVKATLWLGLLGLVMAVFGLIKLGGWWLRMLGTSVTVTTKRTVLRLGFFHSQLTEIPHTEVADIEVHQTLLNRLMEVGDIALVTKVKEKPGILLMGLPRPEEIAHHIRVRRKA